MKVYGIRCMYLIRRGKLRSPKDKKRLGTGSSTTNYDCVHFVESMCKSHKLTIRSSYGAEALASAHGIDCAYPTLITIQEIKHGPMSAEQLKNVCGTGGLKLKV